MKASDLFDLPTSLERFSEFFAPEMAPWEWVKNIKDAGVVVKGCSHITGGGFDENIPRMLPDNAVAVIKKDSYEVPEIFKLIAKKGNVSEDVMYNTFNMGIGMVIALDPDDVVKATAAIEAAGDKCYVIGTIENGTKGVKLC